MGQGVDLLERAIEYARDSLGIVTPELLASSTPCRDWDLRALLVHLDDSFGALREAADGAVTAGGADAECSIGDLRDRAGRLLDAWRGRAREDIVLVEGFPVSADLIGGAGAIEIAVHGWDIARACGRDRPIPGRLATDLLELCPAVITDADRPGLFAEPVPLPPDAGPAERLLALLGRDPRRS